MGNNQGVKFDFNIVILCNNDRYYVISYNSGSIVNNNINYLLSGVTSDFNIR